MACKVAAGHRTADVVDEVILLQSDQNVRVSLAAMRAARRILTVRQ